MLNPALKALLIQMSALLMSMIINTIFFTDDTLDIQYFFILHASLALLLTLMFRIAIWWRYIHFLSPLLMGVLYYLQLPSWIYLIAFILSLGVYWTTYATQVPFYPSCSIVWQQVADLLIPEREIKFIDIGSGIGDLCTTVALLKPCSIVTGIEIAPIPWLISKVRGYANRSSANFKIGNYNKLNFSDYDIVFAYLSPAAMTSLWEKAQAEMRSQSLLISYEFEIPNVKPSRTIKSDGTSALIYLYLIQRSII